MDCRRNRKRPNSVQEDDDPLIVVNEIQGIIVANKDDTVKRVGDVIITSKNETIKHVDEVREVAGQMIQNTIFLQGKNDRQAYTLASLNSEVREKGRKIDELNKKYAKALKEIAELKQKLGEQNAYDICNKKIESLEEQVEVVQESNVEIQNQNDEMQEMQLDIQARIMGLEAVMTEFKAAQEEIKATQDKFKAAQDESKVMLGKILSLLTNH